MYSCILLAAGFSSRFGSPKALARFSGGSVIERLQNTLLKSKLTDIIIVLGAHDEQIRPLVLKHKTIRVVHNKDYNLGQTCSFKIGLAALKPETRAVLLLPVDYPLISTAAVDALIDGFAEEPCDILVPTFNARRGHPPVFNASLKKELLALDNGRGINSVFSQEGRSIREMELKDPGVVKTFNTPEEFEALRLREII